MFLASTTNTKAMRTVCNIDIEVWRGGFDFSLVIITLALDYRHGGLIKQSIYRHIWV
jgi:hypothetical protein